MTFCPRCGCFSSKNEKYCLKDGCVISKDPIKGSERKLIFCFMMFTVTTEHRFCGHCNKVFYSNKAQCPFCKGETSQLTESHLQKNVVLLSGTAAARFWEP